MDVTNPLFLHGSDSPGLVLVTKPLTGDNYATWEKYISKSLNAKNKLGFVNGTIKSPCQDEDPDGYALWSRCNDMVQSWIINTLDMDIGDSVKQYATACQVWEDLRQRFSQNNAIRIYEIQRDIACLRQDQLSVAAYYTKLKILWDELSFYSSSSQSCCCQCGGAQQRRLMQFLMGLNDSYCAMRELVLKMSPLPSVLEAYSSILQAESEKVLDKKNMVSHLYETDIKRRKTGSTTGGQILKLPLPLISVILSRLTVETIFSCKCVCKTFLEILTDPYFVELHLTTSPNIDNGLIIQDRENISSFLLVYNTRLQLERSDSKEANCDSRPCQTMANPAMASQFYNSRVSFVGSYNGLLCLRYSTLELLHIYYICNPILGEFLALPQHVQDRMYGEHSGFGFCLNTKQYKVFRFVTPSICSIHTLGTDCWRQVGNAPLYPRTIGSFDSSFNGNLHWITESSDMSKLICSFNLETEEFSYISSPVHYDQDALFFMISKVGLLDGLFCFYCTLGEKYEAFVMQDYGPKGRWTKKFSIDLSGFNVFGIVLTYLNNGDLVKKHDLYTLVYCNIWKETTRYMLDEKKVSSHGVLSFVPSFISLKDLASAAVGHWEVVQRKMGRNLWTENGFKFIR